MNISLEKAIKGFHLANEAEGLSPRTIIWHDANLSYFYRWLKKQYPEEIALDSVNGVQIKEYLNCLRSGGQAYAIHPFRKPETRKMAPRTIQAYFSSISAFFNWTVREELISKSPTQNIPRPKSPKFLPDPFSDDELHLMFAAANKFDEAKSIRITAIMMLLLDTALRMNELLSICMDDIQMENGRLKVMGKGAKERYVFFGKSTKHALWKYITMFRAEPYPKINNLFLTMDGGPIPQRRLAHMLDEIGKVSNVNNVHPHRWRRTASIIFLKNSHGNLLGLQKMLGHESLEMVKRYLLISDDMLEKAHKEASPVDNLRIKRGKNG